MTSVHPPAEVGGEREIDLRCWRDAVFANRWYVVAGLVIGLIVGGLYSLSGGSAYSATVTVQPAQPFSPSGSAVLNYSSSPLAIQLIANSPAALAYVSARSGIPASQLKGHVSTASISTGSGPIATRGTVLIAITVTDSNPLRAQRAATAFGNYVKSATESAYVRTSLLTYAALNRQFHTRLALVDVLISSYQNTLKKTKFPDPFDQLVLVSELDAAIERQGNLQTSLITNQQNVTLAKNIEIAQIITPAKATKVTARSRRDSVIFGGVIGLIIGVLVALVVGLRQPRAARAH